MKKFLAAVSFLLASSAFAEPLATLHLTGGFCRVACGYKTLTIDDNGDVSVEVLRGFPEGPAVTRKLATLDAAVIEVIKKDIALVAPAPLVDSDPNGFKCVDGGVRSYSVFKDGEKIEIASDRACKKFNREDGVASSVVETLRNFFSLYLYAE